MINPLNHKLKIYNRYTHKKKKESKDYPEYGHQITKEQKKKMGQGNMNYKNKCKKKKIAIRTYISMITLNENILSA